MNANPDERPERPPATNTVTAVRPAHGGFPNPETPTVNERLAKFLVHLGGEVVHIGYLPDDQGVGGEFLASVRSAPGRLLQRGYGSDPLDAIERMLAEAGR